MIYQTGAQVFDMQHSTFTFVSGLEIEAIQDNEKTCEVHTTVSTFYI